MSLVLELLKQALEVGADRQFQETSNSVPEYNDRAKLNPAEPNTLQERKKVEKIKLKAKTAADFAPGLPSKNEMGDVSQIPIGQLLNYVDQEHAARRANLHHDIRFGPDRLYSWAMRKGLPKPGEKHLAVQQSLHRGSWANFEGEIMSGNYGAGMVKKHEKGSVIVTKAEPDKINFSIVSRKAPEFFSMIKLPKNPKHWLMVNTTPQNLTKFLGGTKPEEVGAIKPKYTLIPAADVQKVFDPKYLVQEKIDGAAMLFKLFSDKIEAVSYRSTKEGKPIVHTYRIFGPSGATKSVKVPKEFQGSILRGEAYGVKDNKAIPPQELGGLLNSSVEKSLRDQKLKGVEMRNALFDIVSLPTGDIKGMLPEQRRETLQRILTHLPQPKFHLPEQAETPEEAKALWERITSGQNPRTEEGVVAYPRAGGRLLKVKQTPETSVFVRNVFPGEGRLAGQMAGGFEYSRSPEGEIVGRVGTGFSDETRRRMLQDKEDWVGRTANVRSQSSFPSGALRAPAFLSLSEDYPAAEMEKEST